MLQYNRSVYEPFEFEDYGENAVGIDVVQIKLFYYMARYYYEDPEPYDDEPWYAYKFVTKENFKAMQPILFPNKTGDEELMTREWRLRDYDNNGELDWYEFENHLRHYNLMKNFWNQMKLEQL